MSRKWTPDLTKALVGLYELQPILYKIDSPTYHNSSLRHKALDAIKCKMESCFKESISVAEITKKINNLRTQFLEANRKLKTQTPNGSGGVYRPNWWLYEHMLFLLPYVKKDAGKSKIEASIDQTSMDAVDDASTENYSNQHENAEVNIMSIASNNTMDNDLNDDRLCSLSHGDIISPTSTSAEMSDVTTPKVKDERKKRKRLDASTSLVEASMLNALESILRDASTTPTHKSHLFGQFVAAEMDNINDPQIYKRCKRDILQVVFRYQDEDDGSG